MGSPTKERELLLRYREISAQSNVRYLDALSQVQDPTPAVRDLDALTSNASTKDGRTVRAFNPLSRNERMLFEVLLAGEHDCTVSRTATCDRSWRALLSPRSKRRHATEPGHSVVPPSPGARTHRQNPALAPLAGLPGRSPDHVHRDQAQGGRLPGTLRRYCLRSTQHLREKRRIYERRIYLCSGGARHDGPPLPRPLTCLPIGERKRMRTGEVRV